jgi:hypothetical protein
MHGTTDSLLLWERNTPLSPSPSAIYIVLSPLIFLKRAARKGILGISEFQIFKK